MSATKSSTETIPRISEDIRIASPDADGVTVVKNHRKQRYMRLGPQESFLLSMLDGQQTYAQVVGKFEQQFSEPLTIEELSGFVALARKEGLVQRSHSRSSSSGDQTQSLRLTDLWRRCRTAAKKQSLLFFRVKLFDPDAVLNRLEPRTRALFSPTVAVAAMILGCLALGIVWSDRSVLVQQFSTHLGWKTLAVFWLTIIAITILHEFGHGLACKRYGGEVHEMGALWIFFTPCLYCNVSDAWLLPSRWQRLLISMAGTYVDFLVWIVAVFVWRATTPDSSINFAAWVVVSACGIRVAFNLNPLMRLDGYYALCDVLNTHNLRRRARARFVAHVRWLAWGGEKPGPDPEHGRLLTFGMANWIFTVGFLGLMSFQASLYLQSLMGISSLFAAFGFFCLLTRRYFSGTLGENFRTMLRLRKFRLLILLAVVAGLLAIPIHDRAGGEFYLRPVVRREVRAPIAGFVRDVHFDEGDVVAGDAPLAVIEVPDLISNLATKRSEIAEVEAILRRLTCGPRQEQIDDQKARIVRASDWRDLAISDLERARQSLDKELAALELSRKSAAAQLEFCEQVLVKMQSLHDAGGLAGQQLLTHKKNKQEAVLEANRAEALKQAREAEGVIKFEGELARREKELADAQAALTLLEAGSRQEDIEAEQAHLQRLKQELNHLLRKQEKQIVKCPVGGTIITPHLKEKIGVYVDRGTPLCVIEDLQNLEAEISISEKDARVLVIGQPITLKPRSLPFESLTATVDRIAPAAQPVGGIALAAAGTPPTPPSGSRTVTVYCKVDNSAGTLRTGMTGFGRIHSKRRPSGVLLVHAMLRILRTEFQW
ncbi:efflux RND transporter periplasmic adaptor subunit [Roseimaritima ulvae]|uniref:Putative efflux pump membrane fusion protein n=1 Tax=Roseimaritima ulvae TaxID=980254 RepID=A0A5B9QP55_9BACT|nr:efflux RND transporter periplasmic adaptor subunit [Roseimaritima ulvae]QEG40744.1 putative efflux pump membrane fusion protein [Roseimaritima ulvae]